MVANRGGRVVLQCQPELFRLLKGNPRLGEVISADQAVPEFDFHCPLLSLPRAFGTDIESIPATTPYLEVDAELAENGKTDWLRRRTGFGSVWSGREAPRTNGTGNAPSAVPVSAAGGRKRRGVLQSSERPRIGTGKRSSRQTEAHRFHRGPSRLRGHRRIDFEIGPGHRRGYGRHSSGRGVGQGGLAATALGSRLAMVDEPR